MKEKPEIAGTQKSWKSHKRKPWKPPERVDKQLISFEFVGDVRNLRVVIGNTYERVFNIQQQPFTESKASFDAYLKPTGKFREI